MGILQLTHLLNEGIDAASGTDVHSNADVTAAVSLYFDGPLRPRDLTARTGLTRGGTSNLIDRLSSHGLVTRRKSDTDGRGVVVELTSQGNELVDQIGASIRRTLTLAVPLIESWREHFMQSGHDLGRRRVARDTRQSLAHALALGSIGSELVPAYRAAFGTDDTTPYLTLHVLLLATEAGGTHPTWISDATLLSSATTSDLLDRLERRGLVRRTTGVEADRRATLVTATEAGRVALDTVIDASDSAVARAAEVLYPMPGLGST